MDIRDSLPVPTAPAAAPAGYPDARTWAEAEIGEWLAEADEEASAIIDRARAEALRCELAGHQELERLREEAVKVRMATAERVARRLNEARFEADQLLAEAGTQAESMVDAARDAVRDLLGDLGSLTEALPGGAGDRVAGAVARLEALLAPEALAIPGRGGVLDLTGAVLLEPLVAATGAFRSPSAGPVRSGAAAGTDEVVMDDTEPAPVGSAPGPGAAPAGTALVRTRAHPLTDLRPARPEPTRVLALTVRSGEGAGAPDDILPSGRPRGLAGEWWDRLARLVRRAA